MRCQKIAVIFLYLVQIQCKCLSKSDKHVGKRETSDITEDLFPDWVPFKNKHGDELGEFVPVTPKSRLKKRLAQPYNYMLQSFADADDYFEKGPENEGAEYFERGEWSDLSRSNANIQPSDIESVLGILTKNTHTRSDETKSIPEKPKPALEKQTKKNKMKTVEIEYVDDEEDIGGNRKSKQDEISQKIKAKNNIESVSPLYDMEQKLIMNNLKKEEAMQTEERMRDIENMDKSISDKYSRKGHKSYDEYEEIIKDLGMDKYKYQPIRKHSSTNAPKPAKTTRFSVEASGTTNGYSSDIVPTGKISVFRNPSVYMVFDEDSTIESSSSVPVTASSVSRPSTTTTTTFSPTTSTQGYTPRSILSRSKTKSRSATENIRISLVPQDSELRDGEPTLFFPKKRKVYHKNHKSKDKVDHETNSNVNASFEETNYTRNPDSSDLKYFKTPIDVTKRNYKSKQQKNKHYSSILKSIPKNETTQINSGPGFTYSGLRRFEPKEISGKSESKESDSRESESESQESRSIESDSKENGLGENKENCSSCENGVSLRVKSLNESKPTNMDSVPTGTGAIPALAESFPESSQHVETGGVSHENERGGLKEHHSEYHSEHGENGRKQYSGQHKENLTEEAYHDKGDHVGSYHDHGGHDEKHHDEKKHHGSHIHQEHGKKHAEYEESGRHSKGHSTKGTHDVHKKEEYQKNVEFFEEEGDSAEQTEQSGIKKTNKHNKGDHYENDAHGFGNYGYAKGELQGFRKTGYNDGLRGHGEANKENRHAKQLAGKLTKKSHDDSRKWIYHHAHPAKTANFVVIDRRNDQLHHGPQYYG